MSMNDQELNEITEKIIRCAYEVANGLGCGFLEKVYENALRIELACSPKTDPSAMRVFEPQKGQGDSR